MQFMICIIAALAQNNIEFRSGFLTLCHGPIESPMVFENFYNTFSVMAMVKISISAEQDIISLWVFITLTLSYLITNGLAQCLQALTSEALT